MAYCGCWFINFQRVRHYLPQVDLQAHTTILSTASRTKLTQTFVNNTSDKTPEVQYTFPLYDGVSVVSFRCTIGDKVIVGVVKEKNQARADYKAAKDRGEAAGLLEQLDEASDVFTTKIGNIPKDAKAVVEIEYVGELKHDAQLDGVRFTMPTAIAPRYGTLSSDSQSTVNSASSGKIEVLIDVEVDQGSHIEGLSSPSHPIAMTLGRTSTQQDEFKSHRASATLSLGSARLDKDFIIVVNAQDQAVPRALLEQHPDIPKHRALMATLVPKFNIPNIHPEIVFVVDRSGSMGGKIPTLVEALKVFLKSLPLSAKFNICSFGSNHTFLFNKSVPYDEKSLKRALDDVGTFDANYGGTELLNPIKETVKRRLKNTPLEIMVLTDGEIWNQQEAFDFVNGAAKDNMRLFSLGIGSGASTALVEGLARAGNGFAQFVQDNEKMDKKVVRMLKAALSPHITNYQLKVNYDTSAEASSGDDDFEMVDSGTLTEKSSVTLQPSRKSSTSTTKKIISLFDSKFKETSTKSEGGRYDHLPKLDPPKELQAPSIINGLFPFSRTCAYMLLPNSTRGIKSITLQGMHEDTPIELEIDIQDVGTGKTIHQLAAKKAMLETEEGRGWLSIAKTEKGKPLKTQHEADWDRIVEREAVRLGVEFQVAGKFCSFVAVENSDNEENIVDVSESNERSQAKPRLFSGDQFRRKSSRSAAAPQMRMAMMAAPMQQSAFGSPGIASFNLAPSSAIPPPPPSLSAAPTGMSIFGRGGGAPGGALFGSADTTRSNWAVEKKKKSASSDLFSFGSAPRKEKESRNQSLFGSSRPKGAFGINPTADSAHESSLLQFKEADIEAKEVDEEDEEEEVAFDIADEGAPKQEMSLRRRSASVPPTAEAKMHRIIGLQRFNGSWTISAELLKLTDVSKDNFDAASFGAGNDEVKATLLAIAWLEKVARKDMEVWEMVVDKAKLWLAGQGGISDADQVVKQAVGVFFP